MRIIAILCLLTLLSCNGHVSVDQRCVKGRFITNYCGGLVIQVLDGKPIGRDWKGFSAQTLQNCVVANLDTLVFKGLPSTSLLGKDSTFYFQYREGGYPKRNTYFVIPPLS